MTAHDGAHATISVPPPTDTFVNFIGSSYVGLYGFEISGDQFNSNTNCSGIAVYGNSHHVVLWKNSVHDFPGGGINCFDVNGSQDLIDLSYNRICRTSRYSPSNTSGISIFAPLDLTGGERFADGFGYRVVGNYIYDVLVTVPNTPEGFDYVTDGNGISLDKFVTYDYRKPVLVRNNIVTGCGGRGIYAYRTSNVEALYNTAIGNLRTVSSGISNGAEIGGTVPGGVTCVANAICPLHTANSTDRASKYVRNVILGGTDPIPPGNFDLRSEGLRYFSGPLSTETLTSGTCLSAFTVS